MAIFWVTSLLVLLVTVAYVWFNDEKLNSIPPELVKLTSNRWSPGFMKRALQKAKDEKTPFRRENLPARTGRRYVVVGGVSAPYLSHLVFNLY